MTTRDLRARNDERITLTGRLESLSGLHLGSGYGSERTDATIIRDAWGNPFIPGSSFKGALRSAIERTIRGVDHPGLTSCQLAEGDYDGCLTTNRGWQERYRTLQEGFGSSNTEQDLYDFLFGIDESEPGHLCDTCRLFGSPFNQSRLLVKDLAWLPGKDKQKEKRGEIRHGVGIDRDTLTARDQIKYDFEALPSQVNFQVELVIDRPSPLDLAVLVIGLQEMSMGAISLGGIRSRGLGRCQLHLETVQRVRMDDKASLLSWLRSGGAIMGDESAQRQAMDVFLSAALDVLESAMNEEG